MLQKFSEQLHVYIYIAPVYLRDIRGLHCSTYDVIGFIFKWQLTIGSLSQLT